MTQSQLESMKLLLLQCYSLGEIWCTWQQMTERRKPIHQDINHSQTTFPEIRVNSLSTYLQLVMLLDISGLSKSTIYLEAGK
jgi:hypothetical protein